ncbi:hypothetical protein BHM03_00007133, partial [Ensete ventricosum]
NSLRGRVSPAAPARETLEECRRSKHRQIKFLSFVEISNLDALPAANRERRTARGGGAKKAHESIIVGFFGLLFAGFRSVPVEVVAKMKRKPIISAFLVDIHEMEPDLVLEVPDTPDRLAQLANKSSGSSSQNENINVEVDPLSPSQGIKHLLQRRNSKHLILKDIGERYDSTRSTTLDDKVVSTPGKSMSETVNKKPLLSTSYEVGKGVVSMDNKERVKRTDLNHDTLTLLNGAICEDAKRKRGKGLLGENSEVLRSHVSSALLGMGSSLPSMSVGHGRSQIGTAISDKDNLSLQDAHADTKSRDKGKGVDSCSGVHSESHHDLASVIQTVVPQRPRGLRRLVRNGCISPYNIARVSNESEVHCQNGKTSNGQKCSSFARISDQDKLQGIDILDDLQPKVSQRKLLRNVCISHDNSSGSSTVKQPIEDELMEIEFRRVPKPNGTSNQIHNVNPDSRGRSDDVKKGKGKAKTDIYTMTNGHHGKANLPLSR